MKKKYLVAFALSTLFLSGCSASVLMGDSNLVSFCAKAVDGIGCEGKDQTTFDSTASKIQASMHYKGGKKGDLFKSIWSFEKDGKFAEYTIDLKKDHNPLLIFTVTQPYDGWPKGAYEFALYKNDDAEPVVTRGFTVE